jgi:hypothetical protein
LAKFYLDRYIDSLYSNSPRKMWYLRAVVSVGTVCAGTTLSAVWFPMMRSVCQLSMFGFGVSVFLGLQ